VVKERKKNGLCELCGVGKTRRISVKKEGHGGMSRKISDEYIYCDICEYKKELGSTYNKY